MVDFRKIKFGCADAQTEGADYPELMKNGYVDIQEVVDKALFSSIFLFLGYKGSGKSSLSEHLRLYYKDEYWIDQEVLKEFPFKSFYKILPNCESPFNNAKVIWRWILLTKVLCDLMDDEEARSINLEDVKQTVSIFTKLGIFPLLKITDLIVKSSTNSFKISIKDYVEFFHSSNSTGNNVDVNLEMLISYVKRLIVSFKESRKHLIVIDDLDDILAPNGNQFYTISALISESKDVNRFLKENNIPTKILVLCRTDMFERLPDPNKNKIKQDFSFTFSWYYEGVDKPWESNIIQLANLRAKLVYPEVDDIFETSFPKFYKKKSIYNALLDLTRHTPRDFIQLLNSIQRQCQSPKVMASDIEQGMKSYSSEYFVQEIKDEMTGYVSRNHIDEFLSVISNLHSREFSFKQLEDIVRDDPRLSGVDCIEIMNVMYDCSAIGHVYYFDADNSTRITFKYRNH